VEKSVTEKFESGGQIEVIYRDLTRPVACYTMPLAGTALIEETNIE